MPEREKSLGEFWDNWENELEQDQREIKNLIEKRKQGAKKGEVSNDDKGKGGDV